MANMADIREHIADYVKIYKFLEQDFCLRTIQDINREKWEKHSYYHNSTGESQTYDDDFYVNNSTGSYKNLIQDRLWIPVREYIAELNMPWFTQFSGISSIRFNRYDTGTNMKNHCDHIHTLFDGHIKGIPILTILGLLNDDFQGGELELCAEIVNLDMGDVIIFPSNFMYPHQVNTITRGTRYSFVSWVY